MPESNGYSRILSSGPSDQINEKVLEKIKNLKPVYQTRTRGCSRTFAGLLLLLGIAAGVAGDSIYSENCKKEKPTSSKIEPGNPKPQHSIDYKIFDEIKELSIDKMTRIEGIPCIPENTKISSKYREAGSYSETINLNDYENPDTLREYIIKKYSEVMRQNGAAAGKISSKRNNNSLEITINTFGTNN